MSFSIGYTCLHCVPLLYFLKHSEIRRILENIVIGYYREFLFIFQPPLNLVTEQKKEKARV